MYADDLVDKTEACELLGGISAAILARGVKAGRFPKPLKLNTQVRRWSRAQLAECVEALKAQTAA